MVCSKTGVVQWAGVSNYSYSYNIKNITLNNILQSISNLTITMIAEKSMLKIVSHISSTVCPPHVSGCGQKVRKWHRWWAGLLGMKAIESLPYATPMITWVEPLSGSWLITIYKLPNLKVGLLPKTFVR